MRDDICRKPLKKNALNPTYCYLYKNHTGRCKNISKIIDDYCIEYNNSLLERALSKIKLDSFNTAGNSNKDCVKNRSARWDQNIITSKRRIELNKLGRTNLGIRKKEFAPYEICEEVYKELVRQVFSMTDAPIATDKIKQLVGIPDNILYCEICGGELLLINFRETKENCDGNEINLGHIKPLSEQEIMHRKDNVALVHRRCNIIQSDDYLHGEVFLKRIINILIKNIPITINKSLFFALCNLNKKLENILKITEV